MKTEIEKIKKKYELLKWSLNEKQRRLFAWAEALVLWYWWIEIVSEWTWLARDTVKKWKNEVESWDEIVNRECIRRKWWWRKKALDKNKKMKKKLISIIEEATRWDPEAILTRVSRSLRNIEWALKQCWFSLSHTVIWETLDEMWYSLQANKKTDEWWEHEDRDQQFQYINEKWKKFQDEWCPVLSVDTKKKELIGNFKNNWKELQKKWEPREVKVYDFPSDAIWKAVPYWVYDIWKNEWWVNVWISHDTSEFAVESIRKRKKELWNCAYKSIRKIYITADWWWSNWVRTKLRKVELQKLANDRDCEIHISHYPSGTSKRNKIEHRLFSFISQNWRWKPLVDYQTIVQLIWNTKNSKWLKVKCVLDKREYKKWIKVPDDELLKINIERDLFHGERNYIIRPNK